MTLTLLAGKDVDITAGSIQDETGSILEGSMVKFITKSKSPSPADPD